MKRPEPSMFRNVPESERPVGEPIGAVANRVLARIDAARKEFSAKAERNRRAAEEMKSLFHLEGSR